MNIIERAKNIIMTPQTEWDVIKAEEETGRSAIMGYALPLIAIGAIAAFIGYGIVGFSVPFVGTIRSISWGLSQAIITFLGGLISIGLASFIIDMLAPNFKSEKNINQSIRLVVYSYTPAWICGVFMILPALGLLSLIGGIYGLILLWKGMPIMKSTPEDQKTTYFIVSLLVIIVVGIVVSLILGMIMAMFISNPATAGLNEATQNLNDALKNMGK
jgi:hypothetical protein